jgi:hypothetical protein
MGPTGGVASTKVSSNSPSTHSSGTPADSIGSMQHHLEHFLLKVGVYELDKAGKTFFPGKGNPARSDGRAVAA